MFTRRAFLRWVAVGAAAAAAPRAAGGILRRLGVARPRAGIPALVASREPAGPVVHLAGLPAPGDGIAIAYAAEPASRQEPGEVGRRWVMVIDLARCDGCGECTRACTAMHFVPSGQEWIRVYEMRDHATGNAYWLPRPCMHCDNPPCVKVCPVSATWKREDGIVMQDTSRCIGCRFCIAACPYQARGFNWVQPVESEEQRRQPYDMEWNTRHFKGTTEKCIFCPGLIREGKLPACVQACPMGAIYFGDQREDAVTNSGGETVRFSTLVQENAGYRLLEELGTEPRVYYLPPRRRLYPPPPSEAQPAAAGGRR
jgi:molybdopterin-containing oxidoreductase family iron-sulfur binding subunit